MIWSIQLLPFPERSSPSVTYQFPFFSKRKSSFFEKMLLTRLSILRSSEVVAQFSSPVDVSVVLLNSSEDARETRYRFQCPLFKSAYPCTRYSCRCVIIAVDIKQTVSIYFL